MDRSRNSDEGRVGESWTPNGEDLIHTGIDCSSRAVHATLIDDEGVLIECVKFLATGKTAADRFPDIAKGLAALPDIVYGGTVAIEKPIYFKNPHSTISISEVVGAVKGILEMSNIPYKIVDNRVWKKEVIGMGNASKEDIMKYAIKYFSSQFVEQDWADAACIAEWSRINV